MTKWKIGNDEETTLSDGRQIKKKKRPNRVEEVIDRQRGEDKWKQKINRAQTWITADKTIA